MGFITAEEIEALATAREALQEITVWEIWRIVAGFVCIAAMVLLFAPLAFTVLTAATIVLAARAACIAVRGWITRSGPEEPTP